MTLSVRRGTDDDIDAIQALDARVFHGEVSDEERATARAFLDPERLVVLEEDGRMVGCSANLGLTVTVPGGASLPMTGVTFVGVLPTHHRRGGLRAMMAELLADGRAHQEPVAGLYASESLIYRRFGFGPAARVARTSIETRHTRLREPLEPLEPTGSIDFISVDEAPAVIARLWPVLQPLRNGLLLRRPGHIAADYSAITLRRRGNPDVVVHRDASGAVDGLACYSFRQADSGTWTDPAEIQVHELWATSGQSELELWSYIFGLDFATTVVGLLRPADELLLDRLLDPRRLTLIARDGLHLRPLDVGAMLSARRYGCDGTVVLEVVETDTTRARYRLSVDGGRASVAPTDAGADLRMPVAALGSIYLGDVPVERLVRAGVAAEITTGAAAITTRLFHWDPVPWPAIVF